MIPIKIRLMEYIRKQGDSVKNNDNRIPALLELLSSKDDVGEGETIK